MRSVDHGFRDAFSGEERERNRALEREVKELRRANGILKLASTFFAQAEVPTAALRSPGIGDMPHNSVTRRFAVPVICRMRC